MFLFLSKDRKMVIRTTSEKSADTLESEGCFFLGYIKGRDLSYLGEVNRKQRKKTLVGVTSQEYFRSQKASA